MKRSIFGWKQAITVPELAVPESAGEGAEPDSSRAKLAATMAVGRFHMLPTTDHRGMGCGCESK